MGATTGTGDSARACLQRAADEIGLAEHYRDCVLPLLRAPESRWPRCCGGGCEPCAETLKLVARRTLDLLQETEPDASGRPISLGVGPV